MLKKTLKLLLWSVLGVGIVFLSGCAGLFPTASLPTLIPTEYLPTAIALTADAMVLGFETAAPIDSPTPTPTLPVVADVSLTPTLESQQSDQENTPIPPVTNTLPPPVEIPYAEIQIIRPGSLSKVVSPIQLHTFLILGANGRVRVELIGEDGRLIYRKIFAYDSQDGGRTNLWADLNFEITGVAETARLVISTEDEYGRVQAVTSEDLILLSIGNEDINPHNDLLEPIIIEEPLPKVLIQGDELVVSGLVRTSSDLPLLVELITTDGKVIGSRLAEIASGPNDVHRLFAVKIPFTVYSPTWVRVTVAERGTRLPGTTNLSSIEVLLSP